MIQPVPTGWGLFGWRKMNCEVMPAYRAQKMRSFTRFSSVDVMFRQPIY